MKHRVEHPDNKLDLEYKYLPLTRGLYAKVDASVYEWVKDINWYAAVGGNYAATGHNGRKVYLHNAVFDALGIPIPEGCTVDHVEPGETLDNRVSNLRFATAAQQGANRRKQTNNTSGFIGVHWNKGKWQAQARVNGKRYHLGLFDDPAEASRLRDSFVKQHHGDFAVLNVA